MVKSTDLQIPGDIAPVPIQTLRWGGGGVLGRPLDKWGARSPKNFFSALRASVWSKSQGGGPPAPPLDPPLPSTCCVSYVGRLITSTGC